ARARERHRAGADPGPRARDHRRRSGVHPPPLRAGAGTDRGDHRRTQRRRRPPAVRAPARAGAGRDRRRHRFGPGGHSPRGAGREQTAALRRSNAVSWRRLPAFALDYYFATLLLERARGATLIINDPRGLREQNEKLAVLEHPDLCPPTIVTRETTRLRSFMA